MKLNCFRIRNFRRLRDILVDLEPDISIFVGANNSGKTSAAYALDMFVNGEKEKFTIYDFTSSCWSEINKIGDDPQKSIQDETELPSIGLDLWFDITENDLSRVLDLLPSLDWQGTTVGLRIQFQPKSTVEILKQYIEATQKVAKYVNDKKNYKPWPKNLVDFLAKTLSQEYEFKYYALDRAQFDDDFKPIQDYSPLLISQDRSKSLVKSLIRVNTLHAQRYLSDQASNARAEDLSKCLGRFYKRNLEKREDDHEALSALFDSETQFNDHLKQVFNDTLKRLKFLGYPGVLNPHLVIRSALNPSTIMSQDTRVHYSLDGTDDGLTLPDNYNGLGFKNLIYMVIELLDIQARWIEDEENRALLQLIIIEEPEAHLHAQLQQVFIRQILEILKIEGQDADFFSNQLAITTHSPHILYERGFRPIRYFRREGEAGTQQHSVALNLSKFYDSEPMKDFLERYMKLTHCDLFFADAAILVEGTVERILLPLMIEQCGAELKSSYLSILEVGGAYAFRFKRLIEFLGIPALVITDLDSVEQKAVVPDGEAVEENDEPEEEIEVEQEGDAAAGKKYRIGKACMPHKADAITSNQTLTKWLPKKALISELLAVDEKDIIQPPNEKSSATIYVAYQKEVEVSWGEQTVKVAGRTLEEAFALENTIWCQEEQRKHLGLRLNKKPTTVAELSEKIHKRVNSSWFNKTNFALGVLAENTGWVVPSYIKNGIEWLTKVLVPAPADATAVIPAGQKESSESTDNSTPVHTEVVKTNYDTQTEEA